MITANHFRVRIGPAMDDSDKPRTLEVRKVEVLMFTLRSNEKVPLSIQPVDAKGNPAPIDGKAQWISSDETIVKLQIADDGLTCVAIAAERLGNARITVNADADLGDGIKTISGTFDIEVKAGEAVALNINSGEAVPQ